MHNIKLPDAIIAATALVYELTIITRNTKDFEKIEGLNVINPYNA
jgi:predicted nucleic acid-binding protein